MKLITTKELDTYKPYSKKGNAKSRLGAKAQTLQKGQILFVTATEFKAWGYKSHIRNFVPKGLSVTRYQRGWAISKEK